MNGNPWFLLSFLCRLKTELMPMIKLIDWAQARPTSCGFALVVLLLAFPAQAQTLTLDKKIQSPEVTDATNQRLASATNPDAIRVLLSPALETTLVAQVVGTITALNASLGAAVKKGKTLVAFDCSEAAARLRMAQAEQASAEETWKAKTQLRQLDAAGDMEVAMATAAVDRAKAAISLSRAQLGQCTVSAPFSGRIVKVHVKPHQGVNVGAPLLEMISDGPLKLRLNVSSKLLRELRVGTLFEVDIDETGKTYAAAVTAINARVDAVAQSIELEARIKGNPPELLAGMSGIARLKSTR
jgi:membrane fusion protein (multidrug efflux system)